MASIMQFLPKPTLKTVVKTKKRYGDYALTAVDLDVDELCLNLTKSNFDILMRNKNISQKSLLRCAIIKTFPDKVRFLLTKVEVDEDMLDRALRLGNKDIGAMVLKKYLDTGLDEETFDEVVEEIINFDRLDLFKLVKEHQTYRLVLEKKEYLWKAASAAPNILKYILDTEGIERSEIKGIENIVSAAVRCSKCLEMLLKTPGIDPTAENNNAAKFAILIGKQKSLEILLNDERVKKTVDPNDLLMEMGLVGTQHSYLTNKSILETILDNTNADTALAASEALRAEEYRLVTFLLRNYFDFDIEYIGNPKAAKNRAWLYSYEITNKTTDEGYTVKSKLDLRQAEAEHIIWSDEYNTTKFFEEREKKFKKYGRTAPQ